MLKEQYASIKLLQDENFKSGNTFLSRIADGTLSFYVTKLNDYTSHQKVYLLSNDEEKKYRTITGSANFSYQAFRGNQFETIMVADDFQTYDIFYNLYLKTKEYSTQEITEKTLKELDLGHMDELPAVKEVVTAKTVEITMPKEADQYALKQEEFQRKYGLELADWQGRNIIMPLKKTEAFFGIQIGKKGFFDKVKSLWES